VIIRRLHIENLRNLESVSIEAHERLNYLCGDNGAGKTSVLEGISVLSRGRSFRTTQPAELTGTAERAFRVFAEVLDEQGQAHRVGLERSARHWKGRLDGADVRQLSQLTRLMPTVLLEPNSHQLVSGAPELRRRYLDWGMFHVEQGFLESWREYSRALKQRNAALRREQVEVLDSLDAVLVEAGLRLGSLRERFAERVAERMQSVLGDLRARVKGIELSYKAGWKGKSFEADLSERRGRDLERAQTGAGPHRADLLFSCDGRPARAVLSRGEQKAFAAALVLTQAALLNEHGKRPVLLFDDLVSEFDTLHFDTVMELALSTGSQLWVTGTERPSLPDGHAVFHVEQGKVSEVV
jgi:DNA replication and repair protein RecF